MVFLFTDQVPIVPFVFYRDLIGLHRLLFLYEFVITRVHVLCVFGPTTPTVTGLGPIKPVVLLLLSLRNIE